MHLRINIRRRGDFLRLTILLAKRPTQFRVNPQPLAHPTEANEILLTPFAHLIRAHLPLIITKLSDAFPKNQIDPEVRPFIEKLTLHFIRLFFLPLRPLPHIHRRQARNNNEHLLENSPSLALNQHPTQSRIEGQLGQTPSGLRQLRLVPLRHRAHFFERLPSLIDRPRTRRIDKRELPDITQPQRKHPQNHPRKRTPPNLRIGKLRRHLQRFFIVKLHANSLAHPSASTPPLPRTRLRNHLNLQTLHLPLRTKSTYPCLPAIDDAHDPRNGQRSLRDIRRHKYSPLSTRPKNLLLILQGQPGENRDCLGIGKAPPLHHLGALPNLPLPGEKNQDITLRIQIGHKLHAAQDMFTQSLPTFPLRQKNILHWKSSPFHFHHRTISEELRKAPRIQSRRRNHHAKILPLRHQLFQIPQQKINIQGPFVGLINNDGIILLQRTISLRLRQKNPVRHKLHSRLL